MTYKCVIGVFEEYFNFFYNYVKIVTIYNLNANIITKNGTLEVPKLNGAGDGGRTHEYRNHNPRP